MSKGYYILLLLFFYYVLFLAEDFVKASSTRWTFVFTDASDFGSCYNVPNTSTRITVQFRNADKTVSSDTECSKKCTDDFQQHYYLYYSSYCFCGEQHGSCVECDGSQDDGDRICSPKFFYLGGVGKSEVIDTSVTIGHIHPFSTNATALIYVNDNSTSNSYVFSFGDGSNNISSNSSQLQHQYLIPGKYTVNFTTIWDSSSSDSSTKSVAVAVVDPPVAPEVLLKS